MVSLKRWLNSGQGIGGPNGDGTSSLLRAECVAAGHGLAEKSNEADRWVAATARYVKVPLVSHDGVFVDAPGVELLRVAPTTVNDPSTKRKRRS